LRFPAKQHKQGVCVAHAGSNSAASVSSPSDDKWCVSRPTAPHTLYLFGDGLVSWQSKDYP